jgi:hypothetical protein
MTKKYITDPKEIFTLELNKLQRCFSRVQEVGEDVSEMPQVGWRHVEHLRQFNFLLEEALMVGDALIKIEG